MAKAWWNFSALNDRKMAAPPTGRRKNLPRRIDSPVRTIYSGPLCMADNEFKHWAFLSYSPQDNCGQRQDTPEAGRRCWGNWLHDTLETFPIPPEFAGHTNG